MHLCKQKQGPAAWCSKANKEASESHSVVSNSLQPLDYTAHGILQASILEWVAIPSPRGSSQPRDQTQVMSMYDKNHYNIVK